MGGIAWDAKEVITDAYDEMECAALYLSTSSASHTFRVLAHYTLSACAFVEPTSRV